MATRPPSSGSTAATGCTTRWIAAPSLASTRLWLTSSWPTTLRCARCCTTTSLGRQRQLWPATTGPLTMFLTVSPFRAGHGTDSRSDRQMPVSVNVQTVHPCKLAAVRRGGPAGGGGRGVGTGPRQDLAFHSHPARPMDQRPQHFFLPPPGSAGRA